MTYKIYKLVFTVLFGGFMSVIVAQSRIHVDYEISVEGALSTGHYNPYMLTVNRHDILSSRANTGYLSAGIFGDYQFLEHWNIAGGLTANTSLHADHKAFLQELYLRTTYRKVYFEVGARQKASPVINNLLSSGDFIYSGNAKPIPSVTFGTTGFIRFPGLAKWLEVYADFSYGKLFDKRWIEDRFALYHQTHKLSFFTTDVSFHHKQLYLRSNSTKRVYATLGMQHAVFFGGKKTSYETVDEEISGSKAKPIDFLKVIIPKSDGVTKTAGDSFVYGNHLGAWYFDVNCHLTSDCLLKLYMEKPFEDGSGIAFRNGFDGIWGLEFSSVSSNRVVPFRGAVIEYIQTTNQSGPIHWAPNDFDQCVSDKLPSEATGNDNYYNNFFYNGYAYYGKSLGSALLKSPYFNLDGFLNFIDNRVQAWHLGVNGDISSHLCYLVKASYREGLGTHFIPLVEKHHSFDAICTIEWHKGPWCCSASYAVTQGNIYGNSSGLDLKVVYHGKIL